MRHFVRVIDTMTCAVFLSAFSITVVSLGCWSFSSLLIHCKYNVVYIYNKVIFVPACTYLGVVLLNNVQCSPTMFITERHVCAILYE